MRDSIDRSVGENWEDRTGEASSPVQEERPGGRMTARVRPGENAAVRLGLADDSVTESRREIHTLQRGIGVGSEHQSDRPS